MVGGDNEPAAGEEDRVLQPPPADVAAYLSPSYWDERFSREDRYEWLKDYSHFQHLILKHVSLSDRVLEVGCGNSRMSEHMYKDGITHITCTDLSSVAIDRLRERCAAQRCQGIVPIVASMLELPFEDSSFDVVIEKGTMDVLFVNSGDPWNPAQEVKDKVHTMLKEAHRVLTSSGTFISIAFGQPHFRRPFFEAPGFTWSMQSTTFGDGFHYFFYVLKKGTRLPTPIAVQSDEEVFCVDMEHEFMDNDNYLFQSTLVNDD